MTLKNMRANGVRHVSLWCTVECSHHVDILVDDLPDDTLVPEIGRRGTWGRGGFQAPDGQPRYQSQGGL